MVVKQTAKIGNANSRFFYSTDCWNLRVKISEIVVDYGRCTFPAPLKSTNKNTTIICCGFIFFEFIFSHRWTPLNAYVFPLGVFLGRMSVQSSRPQTAAAVKIKHGRCKIPPTVRGAAEASGSVESASL